MTSAFATLMAVCGIGLVHVSMGAVFLVGLAQCYRGRHEYGLGHARSLDGAVVLMVVFSVVQLVGLLFVLSPILVGATQTGIPDPSLALLSGGSPVLAPVGAFFAGSALISLVRSIGTPPERRRLRRALILGVVGAAAGPLLLNVALGGSLTDPSAIGSGVLAAAVAGPGIAALSLVLFASALREIRRNLEAGNPAPVLPRIDQVYPWVRPPVNAAPPPLDPPRPPPR